MKIIDITTANLTGRYGTARARYVAARKSPPKKTWIWKFSRRQTYLVSLSICQSFAKTNFRLFFALSKSVEHFGILHFRGSKKSRLFWYVFFVLLDGPSTCTASLFSENARLLRQWCCTIMCSQRTDEDERRRTEDDGRRLTENGRWRTKDEALKTKDEGRTKDRVRSGGRKTKDGGRKTKNEEEEEGEEEEEEEEEGEEEEEWRTKDGGKRTGQRAQDGGQNIRRMKSGIRRTKDGWRMEERRQDGGWRAEDGGRRGRRLWKAKDRGRYRKTKEAMRLK